MNDHLTHLNLMHLGGPTKYEFSYNPKLLEAVPTAHQNDYFVKFICPEFTALCPITNQPDFATILIRYIPDGKIVESKSLKLYLFSYRNHGGFHEDCVNLIMKDLDALLKPRYIEVFGKFLPRGGLSIHPFVNHANSVKFQDLARHRLMNFDLPKDS